MGGWVSQSVVGHLTIGQSGGQSVGGWVSQSVVGHLAIGQSGGQSVGGWVSQSVFGHLAIGQSGGQSVDGWVSQSVDQSVSQWSLTPGCDVKYYPKFDLYICKFEIVYISS